MFLDTGSNLITPSVCKSPYILTDGVDGLIDPEIVIEPVNKVVPINVFDPEVIKLPVTIWSPINVLEPVVA